MSGQEKGTLSTADCKERLRRISSLSDKVMALLGFLWLALFLLELTRPLTRPLVLLSTAFYAIFLGDFILRLATAGDKWRYLRKNWLLALCLIVPALRFLRVLSVLRGAGFLVTIASATRGMHGLGAALRRRGFLYVVVFTIIVTLVSAAGISSAGIRASSRLTAMPCSGLHW